MSKTTNKPFPEERERAVRLVLDKEGRIAWVFWVRDGAARLLRHGQAGQALVVPARAGAVLAEASRRFLRPTTATAKPSSRRASARSPGRRRRWP